MRYLAMGVLIAAIGWTLVILVERALVLGIPLWLSAGVVTIVGLSVAGVGAYRARIDRLGAALVLDEAAGLKERVSTALTCRGSADPFAQATVHDAERTASGVHVPSRVPYRAPDLWPWSLVTVVVAAVFFQFMPPLNLLAGEESADEDLLAAALEERKDVEVALKQQIQKVKERLQDKPDLASLQEDLEDLELPNEPTKTPEDVRREAVKKIEKVSDKLKRQLEADALNALDQLKRDLAKLETPKGDDPGSKLSQALASGDMEAARKALSDLKKMLEQAAQAGDAEAQRKLAEMQKKLDELAKQLAKLADQNKLLKDLENKAGLSEEEARKLLEKLAGMDQKQIAEALEKQLANSGMTKKQIEELAKKIAQNQKVRQQLQSMARAMANMAQACQQCQSGGPGSAGAAALQGAMQAAMGQLSDLEMAEQMMNELQAQLAELEDLKAGICQGNGWGLGPPDPNKVGRPGLRPGYGYGDSGDKKRGAHQYKATKAKTRTQSGQIIGQMLIDGPQAKGEATAEVADAVSSAVRDAEDAVEREEVPRQYRRVVRLYFDRLAGLIREKAEADPQENAPGSEPKEAESSDNEASSPDGQ
ncbi:MAG: hypothetical protein ACE5I3_00415 [Phycisphaerae bacterium]